VELNFLLFLKIFKTSGEMFTAADRMVLDAKTEYYSIDGNGRRI